MKNIISNTEECRRGGMDAIISSIKTFYPNGESVMSYYDLYEDRYRVRTSITVFPTGEKKITRYYYGKNGDLLRIAVKRNNKVVMQYKYCIDYYTGEELEIVIRKGGK